MNFDPSPFAPSRRGSSQRGVATLMVVMLLFFVLSLTAAYSSRNLIFEQRASANQYRSTLQLEAADAGIEWALTMLNSGRIGTDCLPTDDASMTSFRTRYMATNTTTGVITTVAGVSWSACSLDGNTWQCKCPVGALGASDLPAGKAAFAVRLVQQAAMPGIVRIEANGCSSNDFSCLTYVDPTLTANFCRTTACAMFALFGSPRSAPVAAITARQGVSGTALEVYNQDVPSGGVTVHSGGAITATLTLGSLPGTPPTSSLRDGDVTLATLDSDSADCTRCLFSSMFGVRPETFRRQQGIVVLDCESGCGAADVNAALETLRGRVVWLRGAGGLTLDSAADVIGSAANPVTLVVESTFTMAASTGTTGSVQGLVYAGSAVLNGGEVRGALVSASTVTGNGTGRVVYDAARLTRLRLTAGSFARVPGSWRDFP